jgi:hypothetical protein
MFPGAALMAKGGLQGVVAYLRKVSANERAAKLQDRELLSIVYSTRSRTKKGQSEHRYFQTVEPVNVASGVERGPSPLVKDRLYAVWSDKLADKHRVLFSYSKDEGAGWSKPRVLSEQPETNANSVSWNAFMPTVAVNGKGVVAVCWYDSRGLSEEEAGWNLRIRVSHDGGETCSASEQVTEKSSCLTQEMRKNHPKEILAYLRCLGTRPAWRRMRAVYFTPSGSAASSSRVLPRRSTPDVASVSAETSS